MSEQAAMPLDDFIAGQNAQTVYGVPVSYPLRQQVIRARLLYKHKPYARAVVHIPVLGALGKMGIQPVFEDEYVQDAWDRHKWSPDYNADSFDIVQRQMLMSLIRDGEYMAQFQPRYDRSDPGLYIQDIDNTFVRMDTPGTAEGTKQSGTYQGITYRDGSPVTYHVRPYLPQDVPYDVPANEFVHIYRRDLPMQLRGITWYEPVFEDLGQVDEFADDIRTLYRVHAVLLASLIVDDTLRDQLDYDELQ